SGENPVRPSETSTPPPTNPWKPNPTPSTPAPPTKVPDGYHLVAKGETLYAISRKYKIDVPKLKQINNLKNDNIQAGQMLRIR
ncbi:MAG TPA: LysM peptidoglycan-binding domain-containing protein, partial [Saprospiraceae bacterium]|nr:LysM peptidoglycan-binding domain-containing protein [Saprospiraceae bacterium]